MSQSIGHRKLLHQQQRESYSLPAQRPPPTPAIPSPPTSSRRQQKRDLHQRKLALEQQKLALQSEWVSTVPFGLKVKRSYRLGKKRSHHCDKRHGRRAGRKRSRKHRKAEKHASRIKSRYKYQSTRGSHGLEQEETRYSLNYSHVPHPVYEAPFDSLRTIESTPLHSFGGTAKQIIAFCSLKTVSEDLLVLSSLPRSVTRTPTVMNQDGACALPLRAKSSSPAYPVEFERLYLNRMIELQASQLRVQHVFMMSNNPPVDRLSYAGFRSAWSRGALSDDYTSSELKVFARQYGQYCDHTGKNLAVIQSISAFFQDPPSYFKPPPSNVGAPPSAYGLPSFQSGPGRAQGFDPYGSIPQAYGQQPLGQQVMYNPYGTVPQMHGGQPRGQQVMANPYSTVPQAYGQPQQGQQGVTNPYAAAPQPYGQPLQGQHGTANMPAGLSEADVRKAHLQNSPKKYTIHELLSFMRPLSLWTRKTPPSKDVAVGIIQGHLNATPQAAPPAQRRLPAAGLTIQTRVAAINQSGSSAPLSSPLLPPTPGPTTPYQSTFPNRLAGTLVPMPNTVIQSSEDRSIVPVQRYQRPSRVPTNLSYGSEFPPGLAQDNDKLWPQGYPCIAPCEFRNDAGFKAYEGDLGRFSDVPGSSITRADGQWLTFQHADKSREPKQGWVLRSAFPDGSIGHHVKANETWVHVQIPKLTDRFAALQFDISALSDDRLGSFITSTLDKWVECRHDFSYHIKAITAIIEPSKRQQCASRIMAGFRKTNVAATLRLPDFSIEQLKNDNKYSVKDSANVSQRDMRKGIYLLILWEFPSDFEDSDYELIGFDPIALVYVYIGKTMVGFWERMYGGSGHAVALDDNDETAKQRVYIIGRQAAKRIMIPLCELSDSIDASIVEELCATGLQTYRPIVSGFTNQLGTWSDEGAIKPVLAAINKRVMEETGFGGGTVRPSFGAQRGLNSRVAIGDSHFARAPLVKIVLATGEMQWSRAIAAGKFLLGYTWRESTHHLRIALPTETMSMVDKGTAVMVHLIYAPDDGPDDGLDNQNHIPAFRIPTIGPYNDWNDLRRLSIRFEFISNGRPKTVFWQASLAVLGTNEQYKLGTGLVRWLHGLKITKADATTFDVPRFGVAEVMCATFDPLSRCWKVEASPKVTKIQPAARQSRNEMLALLSDLGLKQRRDPSIRCDTCKVLKGDCTTARGEIDCDGCLGLDHPCTASSETALASAGHALVPPRAREAAIVDLREATVDACLFT